jgi:threonine/homoserine/homoserine lactone efflux protein
VSFSLNTQLLLSFCMTAGMIAVIPGPSVLFIVGRALSVGRPGAIAAAAGNALGATFQGLLAAIGVGAVIASLWLARRGETKGLTSLLVLSTSATGVALVLAMQFTSIWAGAALLCVMGFFMLIGNVSAQTLVQNSVDQEYRARVSSLFIIFAYGLPAIGAVISGWLATHVGLHVAIGAGAAMMLLAWLWARPKRHAMSLKLDEAAPASRHGA